MCFDSLHVGQHAIALDCFECCGDCGHCQHTPAEGCSEIALFDVRRDRVSDETSGNGNAAAQCFCKRHNVRHDTVTCVAARKEPLAGASDASLHLVVNEHDTALVTQCSQRTIEVGLGHAYARHR